MANLTINIDKLCELLQAEAGTYSQLRTKAYNAELITGRTYVMTDFQTIYNQVVTDALKTGAVEPLILKASSASTFEPIVASALYPNDFIKYDITIDTTFITSDPCKGRIIYREDENANSAGYDWRTVLNWDGTNEFLTFNSLSIGVNLLSPLSSSLLTSQEFINVIFKDIVINFNGNAGFNNVFNGIVQQVTACNFIATNINNAITLNGVIVQQANINNAITLNGVIVQQVNAPNTDFEQLSNIALTNNTFNCDKLTNITSTVNGGLTNCTVTGDIFQFNTFEYLVNGKTITEALYPELFVRTPCTIYQKPNGEIWYRYYDNTNTLIFKPIV